MGQEQSPHVGKMIRKPDKCPTVGKKHDSSVSLIYTGWVKKVSCCTVIDIPNARQ